MNTAEIAASFIRAAEIDRCIHEHVGPAPLRAQRLPYVHDQADKNGWGKSRDARIVDKKGRLVQGDWLDEHEDPLAEERRAFWERLGMQPTAEELARLDIVFDWLTVADDDGDRRALLAWARSKVGGKSFRRWCFDVEGIHPETGRRRKNRAIEHIKAHLSRRGMQNDAAAGIRVLLPQPEIVDVSDTIAEDVGRRDGLNSAMAPDGFARDFSPATMDFSWADKRNQLRRQREARMKRKAAA
jgi:hypothetical protein